MKRTPLKRKSKKKDKWDRLCAHEKALRIARGETCQDCKTPCGILDAHHYWTNRIGPNDLRFVILGRCCHNQSNAVLRRKGLLAEVSGRFAVEHPAVVRAELRQAELMAELTTGLGR